MAYVGSIRGGLPKLLTRRLDQTAFTELGRDLLYLAGDRIMAVGYTAIGESFEAEKPRVWAATVRTTGGFDPSPDGKRVAISVPTSTAPANAEQSIVFIVNFFDELRRRVPVSR